MQSISVHERVQFLWYQGEVVGDEDKGGPKFQQRGFHKCQGGQSQQREETEPGSAQVQGKMGENIERGDRWKEEDW